MKKYFTICGDVVIASSRFGLAPFSSNKKLQLSCAAIMKNIAANRVCDIFGVLRTPRYRSPAGCDILTLAQHKFLRYCQYCKKRPKMTPFLQYWAISQQILLRYSVISRPAGLRYTDNVPVPVLCIRVRTF